MESGARTAGREGGREAVKREGRIQLEAQANTDRALRPTGARVPRPHHPEQCDPRPKLLLAHLAASVGGSNLPAPLGIWNILPLCLHGLLNHKIQSRTHFNHPLTSPRLLMASITTSRRPVN